MLKIEPEVTKTLAEVNQQLRGDIALERAKNQVRDLHDKIEDDRAGGTSLEDAAAKEKLPVQSFNIDRSGHDPDGKPMTGLPHSGDLVAAAFATDVGVDNDPIETDGGYIWYDVTAVTTAHDRSLDEVKSEVEQRWHNDQVAAVVKAKSADLLDKLKGGATFEQLASANGLKVATANGLKRGSTTPDISARMTDAVFHTQKDAYDTTAGNDPTQWIVFRVTDVKTPGLDATSPDGKKIAQTLQTQVSDDLITQYITRLEDDLGTSVNPSVLAQAMGNSSGGAPDAN
jgi:peptidyl-prolyl cis-trans isomerase D